MSRGKFEDLTGKRFGRLTVIKRVENDKYNRAQWLCRCDCGNEVVIVAISLKQGRTTSCGCYGKERRIEATSGAKSHFYNPNLTDEERSKSRYTNEHRRWSNEVKKQANYTCNICGKRGGKLEAHHLNDWHSNQEMGLDISNGVCLCKHCHKEFHYCYMKDTKEPCTKEDYLDFKEIKEKYDIR